MTDLYQPRPRRFDEVASAILARIRSGELQPGDRLPPERQLVDDFGVSRTAVREALRSLAAQGLIDSHVGRGTFVRHPTLRHLAGEIGLYLGRARTSAADVRSARLLVEAELASRAAESRTAADSDALAAAQTAGHDEDFYTALATAAGTPMLGSLVAAMAVMEGITRTAQKSAKTLAAAVRTGDADAARAAVLGTAAMPLAA